MEQFLAKAHLGSNPIYVTGHSLGGAEAEYVASTVLPNVSGVTFAAPGIPSLSSPVSTSNLTNYVDNTDPIGNFGNHFGKVVNVGSGSPTNEAVLTTADILEAIVTDGVSLVGVINEHLLPTYASDLNLHLVGNYAINNIA